MRCLFCKAQSENTTGVEHLIPESIGSKKLILPKGLVCDKCNNYFSRKVERPVLSHESMRNVRGWYQVPNKRGNFPSVLGKIAGTDIKVNLRKGTHGGLKIEAEKSLEQKSVNEYLKNLTAGAAVPPLLFTIEIDPLHKKRCLVF